MTTATAGEMTITQIHYALDNLEEKARQRNLAEIGARARYLCIRCKQAYALFCLNPACRVMRGEQHILPAELIDGVKAERRAMREAQHNRIRDLFNLTLWPETCAAVRSYRQNHPKRQFAIAEIPVIHAPAGWSYLPHDRDPFFQQLAPELAIQWETVRVNLADGTYQPSKVTQIDIPRAALSAIDGGN